MLTLLGPEVTVLADYTQPRAHDPLSLGQAGSLRMS